MGSEALSVSRSRPNSGHGRLWLSRERPSWIEISTPWAARRSLPAPIPALLPASTFCYLRLTTRVRSFSLSAPFVEPLSALARRFASRLLLSVVAGCSPKPAFHVARSLLFSFLSAPHYARSFTASSCPMSHSPARFLFYYMWSLSAPRCLLRVPLVRFPLPAYRVVLSPPRQLAICSPLRAGAFCFQLSDASLPCPLAVSPHVVAFRSPLSASHSACCYPFSALSLPTPRLSRRFLPSAPFFAPLSPPREASRPARCCPSAAVCSAVRFARFLLASAAFRPPRQLAICFPLRAFAFWFPLSDVSPPSPLAAARDRCLRRVLPAAVHFLPFRFPLPASCVAVRSPRHFFEPLSAPLDASRPAYSYDRRFLRCALPAGRVAFHSPRQFTICFPIRALRFPLSAFHFARSLIFAAPSALCASFRTVFRCH